MNKKIRKLLWLYVILFLTGCGLHNKHENPVISTENASECAPEEDAELFADMRKGLRSRGDRSPNEWRNNRPRGGWRNLADGFLKGLEDEERSRE